MIVDEYKKNKNLFTKTFIINLLLVEFALSNVDIYKEVIKITWEAPTLF